MRGVRSVFGMLNSRMAPCFRNHASPPHVLLNIPTTAIGILVSAFWVMIKSGFRSVEHSKLGLLDGLRCS